MQHKHQNEQIPNVENIPSLRWVDASQVGTAHWQDRKLTMRTTGPTDWFVNPDGSPPVANAPALVFEFDSDSRLSVRAHCSMRNTFDAAVLFVYQNNTSYAKLCFERAPNGDATVVSVVTKQFSDDTNGPVVATTHVHLRVSRSGAVIAFHYSTDEQKWKLFRLFRLFDPDAPTWVGFMAQAPVGDGCKAEFDRIHYSEGKQPNPREIIEFEAP